MKGKTMTEKVIVHLGGNYNEISICWQTLEKWAKKNGHVIHESLVEEDLKDHIDKADRIISLAWHDLNNSIGDLIGSDPLVLERLTIARYQSAFIHNQIKELKQTLACLESAKAQARKEDKRRQLVKDQILNAD